MSDSGTLEDLIEARLAEAYARRVAEITCPRDGIVTTWLEETAEWWCPFCGMAPDDLSPKVYAPGTLGAAFHGSQ